MTACIHCHRSVPLYGHKACGACRGRIKRNGTTKYARTRNVPSELVIRTWNEHADPGLYFADNIRLIAPRLGMTRAGLETAVHRARRAGLIADFE